MDAWARIEGDCGVRCSVVGDEAEFEIGTSPCALRLVFTESGLQALMSEASGALEKRRAR